MPLREVEYSHCEEDVRFAVIVGGARSGTTLLRSLLDAHSEIGCPPEAGIPALMGHMAQVWATAGLDTDCSSSAPTGDPGQNDRSKPKLGVGSLDAPATAMPQAGSATLSDEAVGWIRAATMEVMRRFCNARKKRVYVDKSLDSVYHLMTVERVYPDAQYIILYRHVMDTIASGLEASPWGFQAYGYAPYTQLSPGNSVAALAHYWLDHVSTALEWEKQAPESCLRVRYEDLVVSPEDCIVEIQRFLGTSPDLTVLERAFGRDLLSGPGDYKVEHTIRVHRASVGHGKRVPVTMIPPALLDLINERLETLGYAKLDQSWNSTEREIEPAGKTVWEERLLALMDEASLTGCSTEDYAFAIVAEDRRALRWVVDVGSGSVTRGDGEVDAVLTGTAEDLMLMLSGIENLGLLVRSGRIRHVIPSEDAKSYADMQQELKRMVRHLQQRSWDGPDGERRTKHELVASEVAASLRYAEASITRAASTGPGDDDLN